jgi:RNA polymerase sigma-70 factor (ECF subfamily)
MDSETQAVARAQKGDADAFRTIVELHGPLLYRSACLITGSATTAEDAVQETFLKAWRGIRLFNAGTNLRGWLIKVLANYVAGTKRRRVLPTIRFSQEVADRPDPHMPELTLEAAETTDEVLSLVKQLRRDERTVIVMHYYLEMSLAEIAQATGWRDGTVRSRLSRALSRLRQTLEQHVDLSDANNSLTVRRMRSDER